jgi:hypothetical protein
MGAAATGELARTCSCPLMLLFVKVLEREREEDSQTWLATDISTDRPANPPIWGTEGFGKPPLLESCIWNCVAMAGFGTGGGLRTVWSYEAPVVALGGAAVLAAVRVRALPPKITCCLGW